MGHLGELRRRVTYIAIVVVVCVIAAFFLKDYILDILTRPLEDGGFTGQLAVLGVTAYRAAFEDPRARVGPQVRTIGGTRVWVLPNPSGLNAHWTPAALAEEFGRLREAAADR